MKRSKPTPYHNLKELTKEEAQCILETLSPKTKEKVKSQDFKNLSPRTLQKVDRAERAYFHTKRKKGDQLFVKKRTQLSSYSALRKRNRAQSTPYKLVGPSLELDTRGVELVGVDIPVSPGIDEVVAAADDVIAAINDSSYILQISSPSMPLERSPPPATTQPRKEVWVTDQIPSSTIFQSVSPTPGQHRVEAIQTTAPTTTSTTMENPEPVAGPSGMGKRVEPQSQVVRNLGAENVVAGSTTKSVLTPVSLQEQTDQEGGTESVLKTFLFSDVDTLSRRYNQVLELTKDFLTKQGSARYIGRLKKLKRAEIGLKRAEELSEVMQLALAFFTVGMYPVVPEATKVNNQLFETLVAYEDLVDRLEEGIDSRPDLPEKSAQIPTTQTQNKTVSNSESQTLGLSVIPEESVPILSKNSGRSISESDSQRTFSGNTQQSEPEIT